MSQTTGPSPRSDEAVAEPSRHGAESEAVGDSPDVRARRFLDAFADIETVLKERYHLRETGLGGILRELGRRDPTVTRNAPALRVFTELRNVLSHTSYRHGEPVASPLASTVQAIERLRQDIRRPRLALEFATRDILTAGPQAPLPELLRRMAADDISQVPVSTGDGEVGLLTTNAIARWVAAHIDADGYVIIDAGTTADALRFAEPHERVKLAKRTTTAAAALEDLTSTNPPGAILITETGRSGEKPLGILSATDVPRLVQELTVQAY